ncbi:MarR family winged helix-turn-helix transcriptional regulator [Lactobacillus sp. PSON]|uniref:MarR family winged helix-turn-helix transcriptional regulator n=1 Tax=Lactobacillus sp. PSON TaxID=3455454 RepID=UPI0040425005
MKVNTTEKINLAIVRANKAYSEWDSQNNLPDYMSIILYELLIHKGLTQKELVNLSDLPKQSINKGIRSLQDLGYVKLIKDNNDKRKKYCSFTEEGKKYAQEKMTPLIELETKVATSMGKEKMAQLAKLSCEWSDTFWKLLKEEGKNK